MGRVRSGKGRVEERQRIEGGRWEEVGRVSTLWSKKNSIDISCTVAEYSRATLLLPPARRAFCFLREKARARKSHTSVGDETPPEHTGNVAGPRGRDRASSRGAIKIGNQIDGRGYLPCRRFFYLRGNRKPAPPLPPVQRRYLGIEYAVCKSVSGAEGRGAETFQEGNLAEGPAV